jgi:hypothetical protein
VSRGTDVSPPEARLSRRLVGAAGALFLAIVASGIWDFAAKPGVSWLSRAVYAFVSRFLESTRDSAYEAAALNASATAPVWLLTNASYFPLWILMATVALLSGYYWREFEFRRSVRTRLEIDKLARETDEEGIGRYLRHLDEDVEETETFLTVAGLVFTLLCLGWFATDRLNLAVVQQAVLARRVFDANVAICAPYLNDADEEQFRARFASMRERNDYLAIDQDLKAIATAHLLTLRSEHPW